MTLQARPIHPHGEFEVTAPSGGLVSGQVFLAAELGMVPCVYQGLNAAAAGDPVIARTVGTLDFNKGSATVIAVDTDVDWDDTANAVVAAGTGDFYLGVTRKAAASGELVARVEINAGGPRNFGIISAAQQALAGAGAVSVATYYTAWTTSSTDAATLADGLFYGQLKKLQLIVDGGTGTLTPASLAGGTTITFADAGDYCLLRWNGSNWVAIELGNDADGATGPVLA